MAFRIWCWLRFKHNELPAPVDDVFLIVKKHQEDAEFPEQLRVAVEDVALESNEGGFQFRASLLESHEFL